MWKGRMYFSFDVTDDDDDDEDNDETTREAIMMSRY